MPEEEQQRRKALFDALFAGEWALRTKLEVGCAARDVTSAQEAVTLERDFQERDRQAATRQREMEERMAALRLESEREAAEAQAAQDAAQEAQEAARAERVAAQARMEEW